MTLGYVRTSTPVTDAELLAARFEIDVAGELFPVTAHFKLA